MIFRGGFRGSVGAVCPAVPTQRSTNHAFVGVAGVSSRPYKSICRGGSYYQPPPINRFVGAACITSRPYKHVFVGAVQTRTAPTVHFPAKKIKFTIQNRVAERATTNVPNRVRVAERPATNIPNRVRVAERPATVTTSTRVFYKLQLQVQFTRIYTIHH